MNREVVAWHAAVRMAAGLGLIVMIGLAPARAAADEAARQAYARVQTGNQLMVDGQFEEALKAYDEALGVSPGSPEVVYNRGLALYRLGRFEDARKAFQDAIKPSHPELESRAKYNLGRTSHAEAIEHANEPQQAINDLTRAISFYKDSLSIDPKHPDPDAQANLAMAERLRTYFEKRMEQQKQQQQSSSQPSSQPQDGKPQPTTSKSQRDEAGSQPSSQPDESQEDQQEGEQSEESDKGQEQQDSEGQESDQQQDSEEEEGQDGEQGKPSDDAESKDQKGNGKQEGSEQSAGEKSEQDPASSAEQEKQSVGDDDKLREEDVRPMLQEARDAEKARREAKRARMMRTRGRTVVPKDW